MAPEFCPNCGAAVPPKAKACPECGSDHQTGWGEDAHSGGLDLPDSEFDYGDFVKREFEPEGPAPRGIRWYWWLAAIAVLAGFLLVLVIR